jgi:hypothetical protein
MTEKRQTLQGISSCDEIFVQAYLDQNFTHKGKGLFTLCLLIDYKNFFPKQKMVTF